MEFLLCLCLSTLAADDGSVFFGPSSLENGKCIVALTIVNAFERRKERSCGKVERGNRELLTKREGVRSDIWCGVRGAERNERGAKSSGSVQS